MPTFELSIIARAAGRLGSNRDHDSAMNFAAPTVWLLGCYRWQYLPAPWLNRCPGAGVE
jgi:hypothetical protein